MAEIDLEHFRKGKEAFVEKRFSEALEHFNNAIKECPEKAEYYFERCIVNIELQKYSEAKSDICKAMAELGLSTPQAYFQKGITCFRLQEYQEALDAFSKCQELTEPNDELTNWIEKCNEKLQGQENDSDQLDSKLSYSSQQSCDKVKQEAQLKAKLRYDWYQTETHVVITILLKNMKKEDVEVVFTENTLSCSAKLPSNASYNLELDLAHAIVPVRSTFKILSSKIEIKMQKSEDIRWASLEADSEPKPKQFTPDAPTSQQMASVCKYPSSLPKKKDWDKIVIDIKKEEEEEKLEGDAALNQLFQKIYANGSDEVKKAMNKSFMESGGTVLSTNWKEVAEQKVDIKPPDGMEWKKWDS